ncbi:MAG: hypothetical protein Kow0020_06120 [Wenzhouxiangellaceae bacterium]
MNRILMATAIALLIVASNAHAERYYKWRDDQGTIHFSSEPPRDRDYEVVNTSGAVVARSTDAANMPAETPPTDDGAEVQMPRELPVDPELVRQRCEQARENLFWLQSKRRILVDRGDGEKTFLDPEEQQRQIEENQAFIDKWCGTGR